MPVALFCDYDASILQTSVTKPVACLVFMVVLHLVLIRVSNNKYNVFNLGDLSSSAVTDCPL